MEAARNFLARADVTLPGKNMPAFRSNKLSKEHESYTGDATPADA